MRAADKPCLVTSREFKPMAALALAYDGGASCRRALEFVVQNAVFRDFNLHVVTVAEGHREDQAAERLAEAERLLNAGGLSASCQVLSGEVETAIADFVKHTAVDLLIVGAYGHGRIRELLIGSTTTQLLRRCHLPVLCFR